MEHPKLEPTFSETSSIISISNASSSCQLKPSSVDIPTEPKQSNDQEGQKLQQIINDHDDLLLDLSLANRDSDQGSNPELNLIDCFKTNSSSEDSLGDTTQGNNETEPRVFSCNYCQRKFYSSQALGGHQNAHKRERTLAKRGQRSISAASLAFNRSNTQQNRYPSMASLPLHGSFNKSLGIQVHSMIHKPSFVPSTPGSLHIYGHNRWSRQPIDQQPAIGNLGQENNFQMGLTSFGSSSSNGVARFESARKFSPVTDGNIRGYWWDIVSPFKTKQNELQKLDLSLKL